MKNNIKISVIMGVYNPASQERLFRSVQSVIDQSFAEWELLLYDDGSQAPFTSLIQAAAALDPRILLLHGQQNRGLARALHVCIRSASGSYIARMDDDDVSKPDRFQKQLDFLETHSQYQWVGSLAELVDSHGVWGIESVPETPQGRDFLWNSPYIHPSVLFRAGVLLGHGGYDPSSSVVQCEDYELFMRLHSRGNQGYNLQEPLLQYWEDRESYRKRTYRRRIREMKVRYHGFQDLGILRPGTFFYVMKPLLVGAVPASAHHSIKHWRKKKPQQMPK